MRLLPGGGTEEEGGFKRAENPQTGGEWGCSAWFAGQRPLRRSKLHLRDMFSFSVRFGGETHRFSAASPLCSSVNGSASGGAAASQTPPPPPPPPPLHLPHQLSPLQHAEKHALAAAKRILFLFFHAPSGEKRRANGAKDDPHPQKTPALPGVSTPTRPLTPATHTHTNTHTGAQWVEKRRNIGAGAAAAGQRGVFTPKHPHGHPPSAAPSRSPQLCHRDPETPAHTHAHAPLTSHLVGAALKSKCAL